jgi:hypothetical protein
VVTCFESINDLGGCGSTSIPDTSPKRRQINVDDPVAATTPSTYSEFGLYVLIYQEFAANFFGARNNLDSVDVAELAKSNEHAGVKTHGECAIGCIMLI